MENMTLDELREFIKKEIMIFGEVTKFLRFTRARLIQIVRQGRIIPDVYLKREIEEYKKA